MTNFEILQSILTLLIGVIAVYIAYQQYLTNQVREKRESRQGKLSVYKRVKSFLNSVDSTSEITESAYNELLDAISEADFLFEEEITDWMSDLQSYANEYQNCEYHLTQLRTKNNMITATIAQLREIEPKLCNEIESMQNQMMDNLQIAHCELKDKFTDHL